MPISSVAIANSHYTNYKLVGGLSGVRKKCWFAVRICSVVNENDFHILSFKTVTIIVTSVSTVAIQNDFVLT